MDDASFVMLTSTYVLSLSKTNQVKGEAVIRRTHGLSKTRGTEREPK